MSKEYEYIIFPDGSFRRISSDELMHWKYIKREKKNGRWVYYYDEAAADKAAMANVKKAGVDVSRKTAEYKKYLTDSKGRIDSSRKAVDDLQYMTTGTGYKANVKKAQARAKKALKKYEAMKPFRAAQRTINKGIIKVANALSKLFSKKK